MFTGSGPLGRSGSLHFHSRFNPETGAFCTGSGAQFSAGRDLRKKPGVDEGVVHDRTCHGQEPRPLSGEEIRVAGAGPNEVYGS